MRLTLAATLSAEQGKSAQPTPSGKKRFPNGGGAHNIVAISCFDFSIKPIGCQVFSFHKTALTNQPNPLQQAGNTHPCLIRNCVKVKTKSKAVNNAASRAIFPPPVYNIAD
jgi:hypothetical protein